MIVFHSFGDGRLGCFHLLAIVNDAAMSMGMQISVCYPAFSSFGTKAGIVLWNWKWLLNRIGILNLICWGAVFHSGLNHVIFPPAVHKGSHFSTSWPPLVIFWFCFVLFCLIMGVKRYLLEVLICISLIISDVEDVFMNMLTIYMPSLENVIHFLCPFF